MKLEELLKGCSLRAAAGDLGVEILGLAYDSRRVRPGDAFFAIRGTRMDGNRFVPNAIEKGAAAIVSALPATPPVSVPWIEVGDERLALARMAGNFYGHPTAQLHLIGITGPNGKTTTTYLVESILKAANVPPPHLARSNIGAQDSLSQRNGQQRSRPNWKNSSDKWSM